MANIQDIADNPSFGFTAPIHYPSVTHTGYKVSLLQKLCKNNSLNILIYACSKLKPIGKVLSNEIVIESMAYDFAKAAKYLDISDISMNRYIKHLVSCNILIKHVPYKSKVYLINPHFYNTFNHLDESYFNMHVKHLFTAVTIS